MAPAGEASLPRTLSQYRILERIGAGGMGEVFVAEDTVLGRKVALKLLPPRTAESEQALRRLHQEARAAAALDHPHICSIYEMKTVEDCTFIAMQFIEGEDLATRLRRGALPLSEALSLAAQIADALAEAHARGIVHRDVKPHNIMVTPRGQAKLLDFGLAQLRKPEPTLVDSDSKADTQSRITHPGAVVGTPAYMSPEQLRGADLDARTDIFSLAVVVYEMLAGSRPFLGSSAADTMAAILTASIPPLARFAPTVPPELERILTKALAKDRDERYQTAADLLVDLRALQRTIDSGITSPPVVAPPTALPVTSVAVLPFLDLSAEKDQQYLCDGMAEEVTNALTRIPGLRVACRTSAFHFRGEHDIREIGARLRVGAVLEAGVRRAGNRLRVTPRLNSVQDGFTLWSDRFDGEIRDVFDIQDEIARAIVDALKLHLSGERATLVTQAARRTQNMEAYQLYLKGLYHWNRRLPQDIRIGLDYFQKALVGDPGYAPAYAGMAACYIAPAYYGAAPPGTVIPLGRAAAEKALQIDETQAEAHANLGMIAAIHDYEWLASDRYFRRAMSLNPTSPTAFMWHSLFNLTPRGRFEEARRSAEHAVELDPLNPAANATLGAVYHYSRDHARAVEQLARTLELQTDFPIAHYYLGKALTTLGRYEQAAQSLETARSLLVTSPAVVAPLALCRARAGALEEARTLQRELEEVAAKRYLPAQALAEVHLGLGENDEALASLEKACDERSAQLLWLLGDEIYDPVRSHPRFAALVKRMALE